VNRRRHYSLGSYKRLAREVYLDVLDLKDIIKQKNNWSHFANTYNHQMPEERSGKTYYLDWIDRFNELRRIPAHKSALRTYQPEDFEFLEWLRTTVDPAIPRV
jgi:DNA sulfur modification protein DndB